MSRRTPLTEAEKERICQDKIQSKTLAEIAVALACSVDCVSKWWKRYRREGWKGLQAQPYGSPVHGLLARFDPQIAPVAVALKCSHPRWGPNRVLVELRTHPQLKGLPLPSRSRLAALFGGYPLAGREHRHGLQYSGPCGSGDDCEPGVRHANGQALAQVGLD